MKPLSDATAKIAARNFERKFVALGRILNHWSDIVGEDLARKAQPVKIHYYKQKGKKIAAKGVRLDIAASAADATILQMQVGLILERINKIFGDGWITSIRFVASQISNKNQFASLKTSPDIPLDEKDQKYLSESLAQIEDSDIKQSLNALGEAILKEQKKDS